MRPNAAKGEFRQQRERKRAANAALRRGDTAPAVLNAANEIAVAAFLNRQLKFQDIARLVENVIEQAERQGMLARAHCLDDILEIDAVGRELASQTLAIYR